MAQALAATPLINPDALAVVNALLAAPLRIVHIAGHGEHHDDGSGGVVLSNGTVLGPREIGAMRCVPELVFVNCCFLGQMSGNEQLQRNPLGADRARFAASVAEQLICDGVRCVVAAGWAVEDVPAMKFAARFYQRLLCGDRFIDAVGAARLAAWEANPRGNTWAAYQCYGDPDWRYADPAAAPVAAATEVPVLASAPALALMLENEALDARYEIPASGPDAAKLRTRRRRDRLERLNRLRARYAPLWGGIGAVAEAFGLAYAECDDGSEALAWYERAHGAADGSASMRASEQLGNLRARVGEASGDAATIDQAIGLLLQLIALRDTAERRSLLGSAYKRQAMLRSREPANGDERESLLAALGAYERAEALCREAGASELHYPSLNIAAVQLRLAMKDGKSAQVADRIEQVRAALQAQATTAPDFWSVCGLVELSLLEALAQGRLAAAHAGIRNGFADLAQRVPAPHLWKSVHDQARFLLQPLDKGTAQDKAAQAILKQLARLAGERAKPAA